MDGYPVARPKHDRQTLIGESVKPEAGQPPVDAFPNDCGCRATSVEYEHMRPRGLCYRCAFIARYYVLDLPGILLSVPVLHMFPSEVGSGIRIVDPMPQTRARFSSMVGQALDLIAAGDPVRFARVRMEIRIIANVAGGLGSVYQPAFKVCTVNLRRFGCGGDTASAIKLLASTFVHDATVGYLLRRWTFRTNRNYDRFDRLCCREARRFMHRLGMAKTPWDTEHLSRLSFMEALTIGVKDFAAAEREADEDFPQ